MTHSAPQQTCWFDWTKRPWLYWLLLVGSAVTTPFAFAPYRLFWLMPLLFAVLVMLTASRPQYTVRSAYLWGLCAYTAQFYWIDIALHDIAELSQWVALPLTLLLPAYLALYPAACFWLLNKFRLPQPLRLAVVLPTLWTLCEFAREHALTGFGWGALGYSQMAASPLAGFTPIAGIHLVTFATALSGGLLACVGFATNQRHRLSYVAGLVMLWGIGAWLHAIAFTAPDDTHARIALVQGNIAQSIKWDPAQLTPTLQQYYDQVAQSHADIIILPETAIPVMRQDLPDEILPTFAAQAQRNGAALAMGIAQYTDDNDQNYQNAVVNLSHINPNTPNQLPFYAKNHLVPFGEYIPLPALTGWLYQLMDMPLAGFTAGGATQKPLSLANQKVAFNICYEDGFGDELIYAARQSSLLANISNMAWYGHSNAMSQHLQQSQARALEMGRYMVRATNTGMTAIINPQGQITALLPPDTAQILYGNVQGMRGDTPFMRLGGSMPLMALLLLLAAILYGYGRRRAVA